MLVRGRPLGAGSLDPSQRAGVWIGFCGWFCWSPSASEVGSISVTKPYLCASPFAFFAGRPYSTGRASEDHKLTARVRRMYG